VLRKLKRDIFQQIGGIIIDTVILSKMRGKWLYCICCLSAVNGLCACSKWSVCEENSIGKKINIYKKKRKKKKKKRRGQIQNWKPRRFEIRTYKHRAYFLAEINISCALNHFSVSVVCLKGTFIRQTVLCSAFLFFQITSITQ